MMVKRKMKILTTQKNIKYVAVDDILKYIRTRFITPFEGTLQGKNIGVIRIHEQITSYNREKYNELRDELAE